MRCLRGCLLGLMCALMMGDAAILRAAGKQPMTTADLTLLKYVSAPRLSPDGKWVAYVVTSVDYAADRATSKIMLASTSGAAVRELFEGGSPLWSPDGRMIAYEAGRGDERGIWIYDLSADSSRFLTAVTQTDHFLGHRAIKNFEWSPDGSSIAYVGAEPPESMQPESDVKVITRILYKTRTSFSDNRRTHLWLIALEGDQPRLLTPGDFDEHSISWAPDGRHIAFISNRSEDPDDNYSDDLWSIDVTSGQVARLTETPGTEFQPQWSPDGRSIAYLATVRPISTKDSPPEDTHLYVLPAEGGTPRGLTKPLDRRVSAISWHPSGGWIYFTASDRGRVPVYRVALKSGEIEQITHGEMQTRQYSLNGRGSSLAYVRSDMTHPPEIWTARSDGQNPSQLTHIHQGFLGKVAVMDAKMAWFDSFDKTRVQYWLMKPVDFEPGKKYPLLLSVHGGPHGMYGYSFSSNFQLLAAEGYGVLFINPRGSSGYGQSFSDGCVLNWGGGDYKDLMGGVDDALVHNPWIDSERMGVVGGSYGGFMTNWIITHTNRFKAAVPIASVSNLISFYGTSLYQLLIEVEFNGKPWENYALLWQWSPLKYIENVTTPTLLMHGENDHDVPIGQAEEMYIALKKRSVETVFVRYPGEGHGIRRPKHRLDYLRRINDWFDHYLKGEKMTSVR